MLKKPLQYDKIKFMKLMKNKSRLNKPQLKLKVNEIFKSIQGESSYAGLSCAFIRLTGCNLRCSYCDTTYAYKYGRFFTIDDIISKIAAFDTNIIELTGGEPLLQPGSIMLIDALVSYIKNLSAVKKIGVVKPVLLIETSGSVSIKNVNREAVIIMDVKTPSSNCAAMLLEENFNYIKPFDEIKFVIGDKNDYEYAKNIIIGRSLTERCKILMSTVYGKIDPALIVKWMLKDKIDARFQIQLHKYIWSPDKKGV